ncbi:MAG: YihY/virulence factor BrkB family protein [Bacteroidota bacterium]
MKKKLLRVYLLLKKSTVKYKQDDPVRLAGTAAFFMIFAMAPIIIIIISIIGILLGQETIQEKIYVEINTLIGEKGTQYIKDLVSNYQDTSRGTIGTIVGFIVFLFASTTFFAVLQRSLNFIWRVKARPSKGIIQTLKVRVLSFGLILSLGLVMIVSLIIDALLTILGDFISELIPGLTYYFIQAGNFVISFGIIMLFFAMIFKFLPDAKIRWSVTWTGAFITTILFMIGRALIGLALGTANISLMYGAAGSLVVILLWVFYSAIIFFYGAEITQQYAHMYSEDIVPKKHAVRIQMNEIT